MSPESVLELISEYLRPLLALMLAATLWSLLKNVLLNSGRRKRLKGRDLSDELRSQMPESAPYLAILMTGRNIRRLFKLGLACAGFTLVLWGVVFLRTNSLLVSLMAPVAFWLAVLLGLVLLRRYVARRVLRWFCGEWLDMLARIGGQEARRIKPLVALASPSLSEANRFSTFVGPVSTSGPAPLEYWAVSGEQLISTWETVAPWAAWAGIGLPGAWTSAAEAHDGLVRSCDVLLLLGRTSEENQPLIQASLNLRWDASVRVLGSVATPETEVGDNARWKLDSLVVRDSGRRAVNRSCLELTSPEVAAWYAEFAEFGFEPLSRLCSEFVGADTEVEKLAVLLNLHECLLRTLFATVLVGPPPVSPGEEGELLSSKRLSGANQLSKELGRLCDAVRGADGRLDRMVGILESLEWSQDVDRARQSVSPLVSGLSRDPFLDDRTRPPIYRCARLVAEVRNRTKGHGVMTEAVAGRLLPGLFPLVARMLYECREVLGLLELWNASGKASADPNEPRYPALSGRSLEPWLRAFPEHDDIGYLVSRTATRSEYLLYNAGYLIRPTREEVTHTPE